MLIIRLQIIDLKDFLQVAMSLTKQPCIDAQHQNEFTVDSTGCAWSYLSVRLIAKGIFNFIPDPRTTDLNAIALSSSIAALGIDLENFIAEQAQNLIIQHDVWNWFAVRASRRRRLQPYIQRLQEKLPTGFSGKVKYCRFHTGAWDEGEHRRNIRLQNNALK